MSASPTLPAAPRTNSLGRAKTDCHTCSQYRRTCDRQRPRCGTCLHRDILCGGYALDLTWTTSNSRRGVKVPGAHKPPVLSPSTSGKAEGGTGTSSRASSATSTPSRQFKFRIGKPKKPRKKRNHESPYGGVANAKEELNCVSTDASGLYEDQPEALQSEQYIKTLTLPISGGVWEAVLPNRVQELPGSIIDPDEDVAGLDKQDRQSLTASVSDCELRYCISGSKIPQAPLFGSLEEKYRGVLLMYDQEFCVRPLTTDCTLNPFRCPKDTSRGSRFLLHAIMALSFQLMSTLGKDSDSVVRTLDHKYEAIHLYRGALSRSETRNLALLDTLLILITLEAAQCALSTWSVHIAGAYGLIEAAGGVEVVSTTQRLTAQVTMLLWWDITIGMISRRGLTFSKSYLDTILACTKEDAHRFFNLTGCPADLVVCMAKLARLASAYEHSQGSEWTALRASRVDDLEATLTAWHNPFYVASGVSDVQEGLNPARDCYHCVEAWRHALILYIYQVLKRDAVMTSPEVIPSYSRRILGHIHCIKQETVIQKQVLLPLFLAGCEATEKKLRKQAKDFCRVWSQRNGYRMFQDVGDLLEHVWKDRQNSADGRYWWGHTVDQYNTTEPTNPMRSQFLFG
ncbi:Zn(2)-C6 fungal-type DNA-binding domain [Lasallia pustulata]|uniref:Zn(2)-C6 fungal-type DNA-binding domain n=1 Tax=Lasallia pustulata TaxID=136370 RepID=A0A1W5CTU0_9LECA|nr:Zn(2)-C6 fungal-type DNA-binding domain [Lasallia pustulata]